MRRKPRGKVRFAFGHATPDRKSTAGPGTPKSSSRRARPDDTLSPHRAAVPVIRGGLKHPRRSGLHSSVTRQRLYLLQGGGCLNSPPKRPFGTPKARYWGAVGNFPDLGKPPCPGTPTGVETHAPGKELGLDAIVYKSKRGTLSPVLADDTEHKQKQPAEDLGAETSLQPGEKLLHFPTRSNGLEQSVAGRQRVVRLRTSTVLLGKPLPAPPRSPRRHDRKENREDSQRVPVVGPLATTPKDKGEEKPDMPGSRVPLQARQEIVPSATASWVPAKPQSPSAVARDKRSPAETREGTSHTPKIHSGSDHDRGTGLRDREMSPSQAHSSVSRADIRSKTAVSGPWEPSITTSSLSVNAPGGAIHEPKLPDDAQYQAETTSRARAHSKKRVRFKPMSPSQRLQHSITTPRQRPAEDTAVLPQHSARVDEQPVPQFPSSSCTTAVTSLPSDAGRPVMGSQGQGDVATTIPAGEADKPPTAVPGDDDSEDISDRDVLRGLRIVCAAAADREFDALVYSRTGMRLRRFLADVRGFEEVFAAAM